VLKLLTTCTILVLLSTTGALASTAMKTSWYGPGSQGKRMASGKNFDSEDASIAAHKDLPFGTVLRLTNPDNGKSILVTVQDRGPSAKGRDLDVSKAAAAQLGIIRVGVKELRVEVAYQ